MAGCSVPVSIVFTKFPFVRRTVAPSGGVFIANSKLKTEAVLTEIQLAGTFVTVVSRYDSERGYSCRILDLVKVIAKTVSLR